jgi:ABC-type dipeptide/oligopeptide/nickel transport systems, permease components
VRANLLDELNKPYVETARAKGLEERVLIWKYPVRLALNPFFSTVGWTLVTVISAETLVAVVLNIQTSGPLLLRALTSQDMYLAGALVLMLSTMTVVGTLISDILLAWADPRIRLEGLDDGNRERDRRHPGGPREVPLGRAGLCGAAVEADVLEVPQAPHGCGQPVCAGVLLSGGSLLRVCRAL